MGKEIQKTQYTIVQRPDYVMFRCPHCDWKHEIDWSDFRRYFSGDVEYEMWSGDCDEDLTCDDCGKTFRLEGVNYD